MKKNLFKNRAVRVAACALLVGAAVSVSTMTMYSDTRPGSLDNAIDALREEGLLDEAIANGYVSQEALEKEGLTGGGTPSGSGSDSGSGENTAPEPSGDGSGNNSGNSSNNNSGNGSDNSSNNNSSNGSGGAGTKNNTTSKKTEKKAEPTVTESGVSGTFVMTTATDLYDTSKKNNKVSSLDAGTAVNVTAETSNGLFKTEDGYYFDKTKCVTADTWESGWQETGRVDATCTEAGSITYSNSNNTEITKTEEIAALGHAYDVTDTKEPTCTEKGSTTYTCSRCGDTYTEEAEALGHQKGEWEVTKEPGLFSEGEKVIKCTVCGEVIETEAIPQTCPLPLWSLIAICAGVIVLIVVIIILARTRRIRLPRIKHHGRR